MELRKRLEMVKDSGIDFTLPVSETTGLAFSRASAKSFKRPIDLIEKMCGFDDNN